MDGILTALNNKPVHVGHADDGTKLVGLPVGETETVLDGRHAVWYAFNQGGMTMTRVVLPADKIEEMEYAKGVGGVMSTAVFYGLPYSRLIALPHISARDQFLVILEASQHQPKRLRETILSVPLLRGETIQRIAKQNPLAVSLALRAACIPWVEDVDYIDGMIGEADSDFWPEDDVARGKVRMVAAFVYLCAIARGRHVSDREGVREMVAQNMHASGTLLGLEEERKLWYTAEHERVLVALLER